MSGFISRKDLEREWNGTPSRPGFKDFHIIISPNIEEFLIRNEHLNVVNPSFPTQTEIARRHVPVVRGHLVTCSCGHGSLILCEKAP